MIIDAHTHIMPQRRLDGLSVWLGQVFPDHSLAGKHFTADMIIEELSQKGVTYIFNYVFPMKPNETEELNLFNCHLSKKFKSIIPFGSLHVGNGNIKDIIIRCIKELGLFGFKLHPYVQGFSPDDERLFAAYEIMERFDKPINIHTGFEKAYPKRGVTVTLEMAEGLVRRFPNLFFIFPHMFYPKLDNAYYLLENYKNVYIDTTNVFSAILQDEIRGVNRDKEREMLRNILNKWSERMVWGTDHPAGMDSLDAIFKDLYSFDLNDHIKQNLLFRTAHKIIKH